MKISRLGNNTHIARMGGNAIGLRMKTFVGAGKWQFRHKPAAGVMAGAAPAEGGVCELRLLLALSGHSKTATKNRTAKVAT